MPDLTRFAWLSVAAAVATIALKVWAWSITGSVGLLSDAAESVVNLIAALVALWALTAASKPATDDHQFGHSKAEYFSAGVEGAMIFIAAAFIVVTALPRLFEPQPLEAVGIGLAISMAASALNGVVGLVLVRAGQKYRSMALEADGKHLWTDVITSIGVLVGIGLVWVTGWLWLDALTALAVGVNILFTGGKLVRESVAGLLDKSMEKEDLADLRTILKGYRDANGGEINFHELRTRESGRQLFVEFHYLVPGKWDVSFAHDLLEEVETDIRDRFPGVHISSHMEPIEDERAYGDVHL
ncbi:cation diffusion facilitator family transporter [Corynebacterium ulceribovis]|uniref:cation diffusion facilitator family transporter n=1 Tax=Corynebacterium ulceribovis TaxID=487732 RepID=UPI00039B609A|nr:cation diffusion facilitator family transporter [Corynebacterium ulceribovis]